MTIHCIPWERPNPIKFYVFIFTQGSNNDCVVTKELESKLEKLIELFPATHTLHMGQETSKTWFYQAFCVMGTSAGHVLSLSSFSSMSFVFSPRLNVLQHRSFWGRVAVSALGWCCLSSWHSLLQRPKKCLADTNCVRRIIITGTNDSKTCPAPFQTCTYGT